MTSQLRRRLGRTKKNTTASTVPPVDGQNSLSGLFIELLAAVVLRVITSICAVVPLMVTDDEAKPHVGGSLAPVGPVTAQVRLTVPVNPPDGVTLIVEVFPLVAPGLTDMLPLLLRANEGATAEVTVTVTGVGGSVKLPEVPVTVIV